MNPLDPRESRLRAVFYTSCWALPSKPQLSGERWRRGL